MRLSRADLVLALVSVSAAAVLTVFGRFGWPELLFFTVMLTSLTLLSREVWRAHRREQELRQEALRVVRIRPDDVAAEAVRDERRRLSEDIAAELRGMLTQVRHEAVHSEDAGATARSIHRHARLASSELRRLLGLLRTSESVRVAIPGASSVEQLESNVAAAELELTPDEITAIDETAATYRPTTGLGAAPAVAKAMLRSRT